MHPYSRALQVYFERYRNLEKAEPMEQYMRNQYPFLGIQAPERTRLLREFLKENGVPSKEELPHIVQDLWKLPEREFQIIALNLLEKQHKIVDETFLPLLEGIITTKSWWDTVDYIAPRLVGLIFARQPYLIGDYIPRWMASGNIWLQRTCILFQLKYKDKMDTDLLFSLIQELSHSKEFFIQKAIGWVLREYAKTSPDTVLQFVSTHSLAPLSKREALKHIQHTIGHTE